MVHLWVHQPRAPISQRSLVWEDASIGGRVRLAASSRDGHLARGASQGREAMQAVDDPIEGIADDLGKIEKSR